jgi:hypothetical protein
MDAALFVVALGDGDGDLNAAGAKATVVDDVIRLTLSFMQAFSLALDVDEKSRI